MKERLILSRENAETYKYLMAIWFAEAAVKTILNTELKYARQNDLKEIADELEGDIANKEIEAGEYLLLTGNDKPDELGLTTSIEILRNPQLMEHAKALPPAFSLEYLEHIRTLFTMPASRYLKRKLIFIKNELLALAVIGAYLTHYYHEIRDDVLHYYYIMIDTLQPGLVNLNSLNKEAKYIWWILHRGDASPITRYVSIAALCALRISRINKGSAILTHIDIEGARNERTKKVKRVTLYSFDQKDLTSLACDIKTLHWAYAMYELSRNYPVISNSDPDEIKRDKRVVKGFIESLARAIYVWHSLGKEQEIYRALRVLSSDEFNKKASKILGDEWNDIKEDLITVNLTP